MLFFTQIQENSSNKTLGDQAILFKFKWFFLEIWQFLIGHYFTRKCDWILTRTTPAGRTTPPGPRARTLRRRRSVYVRSAQAQWGSSIAFQTIKELWKPNLEIYGLEHYETHKILGRMAGLRVTKQRRIKYDTKWVQIKTQLTFSLIGYQKCFIWWKFLSHPLS